MTRKHEYPSVGHGCIKCDGGSSPFDTECPYDGVLPLTHDEAVCLLHAAKAYRIVRAAHDKPTSILDAMIARLENLRI